MEDVMSNTTAVKAINAVSNINEDVVSRLYQQAHIPQPQKVEVTPPTHHRMDKLTIEAIDVLINASLYAKHNTPYVYEQAEVEEYESHYIMDGVQVQYKLDSILSIEEAQLEEDTACEPMILIAGKGWVPMCDVQ